MANIFKTVMNIGKDIIRKKFCFLIPHPMTSKYTGRSIYNKNEKAL